METLPIVSPNELAISSQSAGAIAEIQSAYVMALQRPRDPDKSRRRILDECKRLRFAESAKYVRPVGKDKDGAPIYAEGISIRGAEALQRAFGNILVRADTLFDDDRSRKISVTVIDLESNTSQCLSGTVSKTIERKWSKGRDVISERTNSYGDTVFIVAAFDHEIELKTSALRSKLMRDCILRLIPADIRDEMDDAIAATVKQDAQVDPITARNRLVDSFHSLGVSSAQLKDFLGHDLDALSPDEIVKLRQVHAAVKGGEQRWEDFMPIEVQPKKRTFLDLDNMKPGDPEVHTEPGDVQQPVSNEPIPESSGSLWLTFVGECIDRGASADDMSAVEKVVCKTFKVTKVGKIAGDNFLTFKDWLYSDEMLAILEEHGVPTREPGED